MINPQIVNGCQTTSIVHQAYSADPAIFENHTDIPSVQIRIIESSDPKFTEQVALTTNSQTRIYGRDLRAIDETQLKIELALKSQGYRYLRKRSDKSDLPAIQTIDMARLDKSYSPTIALSRKPQKLQTPYLVIYTTIFLICLL